MKHVNGNGNPVICMYRLPCLFHSLRPMYVIKNDDGFFIYILTKHLKVMESCIVSMVAIDVHQLKIFDIG